jgi:uncharacterized protein (DUF488 family)
LLRSMKPQKQGTIMEKGSTPFSMHRFNSNTLKMGKTKKLTKTIVMTIGHSTHSLEEFVRILNTHGVKQIIDVRTIPKSRHNPQFNKDTLSKGIGKIGYIHMSGLGGLRHAKADSPNTGWRNASFRGYADYIQTEKFEKNLEKLIEIASKKQIAIMCAEAVPWRCHRSLIADALTVRNVQVEHIYSATSIKSHELTPFAKVKDTKITYPADTATQKHLWE